MTGVEVSHYHYHTPLHGTQLLHCTFKTTLINRLQKDTESTARLLT